MTTVALEKDIIANVLTNHELAEKHGYSYGYITLIRGHLRKTHGLARAKHKRYERVNGVRTYVQKPDLELIAAFKRWHPDADFDGLRKDYREFKLQIRKTLQTK